MTERKERRTTARVTLSGTQVVRTLDGVEAHLLDLSLHGARVAHFGTLRPGALCFVQFPADVGALHIPVQVLWCAILGAEWRSDGERHLRSHSGLWFTTLTEQQRTVLAGILQQLAPGLVSCATAVRPQPGPAPTRPTLFRVLVGPLPRAVPAALGSRTNGR